MYIQAKHLSELGGTSWGVLRLPEKDNKLWSAFNPSIARGGDGRLGMTIRSSNYVFDPEKKTIVLTTGGLILNRLWFCFINEETLEIEELREISVQAPLPLRRGVEDARLYWRDGWEITGVVLESHTPLARLWVFSLDLNTNTAVFKEALNAPNPKKIEKNWLPVAECATPEFDFIYSTSAVYKESKVQKFEDAPSGCEWIRGGSPLIQDGDHYVSVTHRVEQEAKYVYNPSTFGMETRYVRHYVHQFAKWDLSGKLVGLSDDFIFHEGGIEYAAGLVRIGDDYVISFGRWDVACWLAKLPVKSVCFKNV